MLKRCWRLLVARPAQRNDALYECLAPFYFVVHPFVRAVAARAAALLEDGGNRRALDLCTGTGVLAEELRKRQYAVTGIDISLPMLSQRRKSRQTSGVVNLRMDARRLGFADKSFDLCAISMGLHEFSAADRQQILDEMTRVSRRHILVADYSGPQSWTIHLAEWLEASHFRDFTRQPLADYLTEAGLRVLKEGRWRSIGLCLCETPANKQETQPD
jgi:ubiquinone/menaquinone biosynthesis C-methylase UbiE